VVKNVNTDEIVAWKDGYFHFENADLHSILRQFSRWYDIEVVYEGELKNRKFLAIVSRNSSLASVLKMLNANNVQFRIEGKKLIVQSY
jgi:ferric-dicitrate binding protein FerR (iron transport regulator)